MVSYISEVLRITKQVSFRGRSVRVFSVEVKGRKSTSLQKLLKITFLKK